jgi:hypothetical protein
MFIVSLETPAGTSYLRGTVWSFAGRRERAQEFETIQAAKEQLATAKKFMRAAHFKAAKIEEA